jgi:hypothetical protein
VALDACPAARDIGRQALPPPAKTVPPKERRSWQRPPHVESTPAEISPKAMDGIDGAKKRQSASCPVPDHVVVLAAVNRSDDLVVARPHAWLTTVVRCLFQQATASRQVPTSAPTPSSAPPSSPGSASMEPAEPLPSASVDHNDTISTESRWPAFVEASRASPGTQLDRVASTVQCGSVLVRHCQCPSGGARSPATGESRDCLPPPSHIDVTQSETTKDLDRSSRDRTEPGAHSSGFSGGRTKIGYGARA